VSDERLLSAEELRAVRAYAAQLEGYGGTPTSEEWQTVMRLGRGGSHRVAIPLLAHIDAQDQQLQELRAVLSDWIDVVEHSSAIRPAGLTFESVIDRARTVLGRPNVPGDL
jgi:hypothetical protein